MGEYIELPSKEPYLTKHFYHYQIENTEIDVMACFKIQHSHGIYELIFDENSVVTYETLNGVNIPLTSLEDWYVLYQLMPNRDEKVDLIEAYLIKNGIKNPDLLTRALEQEDCLIL